VVLTCGFGDPATRSLLTRVEGDLRAVLAAAARGDLSGASVPVAENAAVTVVMAAGGYPASGDSGTPIEGVVDAEAAGALVFHAGTALNGDLLVTNGGRIPNGTAMAGTGAGARGPAHRAGGRVSVPGRGDRRRDAALPH